MANEKRLIDANALELSIDNRYCKPCKASADDYNEVRCRACDVCDMLGEIEVATTVDAIVLPCKVGDEVWFIPKYEGKALGMIVKDVVQMVGITSRGIHLKLRRNHDHNKMHMLGKTVFLTKEEAETELAKMDGDGNA